VPTHAEAMARSLAQSGIQYLFGLPGGEIVAFIDACRREGIRFLLTGHEASAAWMAQVVGQITGVPGVCAATLGPGATNLVTGVANAFLDRAPMLAVTAQIPDAAIGTMTHQRLPLQSLFAPITKGSFAVGTDDTVGLIEQSLELAATPRPGPVHISLASDLATQSYREQPRQANIELAATEPNLQPIIARLEAATQPIVIIGLGATPATAPAVRALIDRLQAPFLVTPKAKGIANEDHPLFAGVASGMAIDRDVIEIIKRADLVLAIGFDPVECDKTWFADIDVVSIDSASTTEGRYLPIEAIGDIGSLLACLNPKPKPWRATVRPREPKSGLSPLRLIEELRSIFPRDGIACCDVGSHKLLMGQFWRSYEPGTFLMSNGLSGMGFGVPAAIAAQLCHPSRSVMTVVGDGGMLMMLHDLALIRELGLPILIVVLSDRSLSLIRVSEERRGIAPYGVDFNPPDFAVIAQSFGIVGRRVASIAEAKTRAEQALNDRAPFLLDIPIDYSEYYDLV
jgi:acetolactate synthase-1/2/3 large subunit